MGKISKLILPIIRFPIVPMNSPSEPSRCEGSLSDLLSLSASINCQPSLKVLHINPFFPKNLKNHSYLSNHRADATFLLLIDPLPFFSATCVFLLGDLSLKTLFISIPKC